MGMLYRRGSTWWVKYYRAGKMYRESSGSSKKGEAKELLQRREGSLQFARTLRKSGNFRKCSDLPYPC